MPATTRRDQNARPGTRTARRGGGRQSRRKRSGGGAIGGVVVAVLVLGGIGLRIAGATKSWDEVDQRRQTLTYDEAWLVDFQLRSPAQVRVTARETGGETINVYWANDSDHRAMQNETAGMEVVARVLGQSFVSEAPSGTGTLTLPRGNCHIYFESGIDTVGEPGETITIDYTIEVYQ